MCATSTRKRAGLPPVLCAFQAQKKQPTKLAVQVQNMQPNALHFPACAHLHARSSLRLFHKVLWSSWMHLRQHDDLLLAWTRPRAIHNPAQLSHHWRQRVRPVRPSLQHLVICFGQRRVISRACQRG
jgi:hypothetical protein